MKKLILFTIVLLSFYKSYACVTCNKQIQDAIWNSTFFPNLITMLSAFIALAIAVAISVAMAGKRHRLNVSANSGKVIPDPVPLTAASVVYGIGFGGFFDGIVFHQILQWHEMISNKMPPTTYIAKSVNMFWDGIFHAFCFIVVIAGVIMFWKLLWRKDINRSGSLFSGGLLAGWGLFNIIEGVIDHQILKLHNVREITTNVPAWNIGFLIISTLILISGFGLVQKNYQKI